MLFIDRRSKAVTKIAPTSSIRVASLSVDLDNEWAYLKAHGHSDWQTYPSYLDRVVPEILRCFRQRDLRVTFFLVGLDAASPSNLDAFSKISDAGHEVGNHSLRHEPWLHRYSEQELDGELAEAEYLLQAATGQHPRGFRGPGYSLSEVTLRVLVRRGYKYDATTLPSFLGPIARAYYFATLRVARGQRERLDNLYGDWKEGLRPLTPYQWRVGGSTLVEIPVTTFPALRVPIHLTYIMYLAGISSRLALEYFYSALALCRLFDVGPSILLHPLDFLDGKDAPRLASFPTMKLAKEAKYAVLEACLDCLQAHWSIVSIGEHAAMAAASSDLPTLDWAQR